MKGFFLPVLESSILGTLFRTRVALSVVFVVKFWDWNSPHQRWNYPDWERRISDGSVIFKVLCI